MEKMTKILIVGEFKYNIYEQAVIDSLKRLEYKNILEFRLGKYWGTLLGKLEYHFVFLGPIALYVNLIFFIKIFKTSPEVVLIWRAVLIHPLTLRLIKKCFPSLLLVSYNNDDPFSEHYKKNIQNVSLKNRINQKRLWNYFQKGIKYFDKNFVYRDKNISDYLKVGAKHADLFMPYFIPEHIKKVEEKTKEVDIVFIGHYENDGREDYLYHLLDNNVNLKVFGTGWGNKLPIYKKEIYPLYNEDYFSLIKKSRIAIVFLSTINNDKYTRRCFEIPACGTMMLSQRTDVLEKLYKEGEEIVFFSTPEEMFNKIKFYLENNRYKKVGAKGKVRAYSSGYDIDSLVFDLIKKIL